MEIEEFKNEIMEKLRVADIFHANEIMINDGHVDVILETFETLEAIKALLDDQTANHRPTVPVHKVYDIISPPRLPKVGDVVINKSDSHGRTTGTVMPPDPDRGIMVIYDGNGKTFPVFMDGWEVLE